MTDTSQQTPESRLSQPPFPITVQALVQHGQQHVAHNVILNSGLTILLGPNGAGKTQLMRGMKTGLHQKVSPKKVRFLSAGRMGMHEQFRSDYDGKRGGLPPYEDAQFGSTHDAARRHHHETLSGDFHTLAARPDILIKVRERLRKLFGRDITINWTQGALRIGFTQKGNSDSKYTSGREASGLLHLVGILAAIYDDEVGALLIDEPEVSLHPQLQAFLRREIEEASGMPDSDSYKKLIILSTHSTEFIKIGTPEDLANLVLCSSVNTDPLQISPDAPELQGTKMFGLVARLGHEHKAALFAHSPLLVEGPSDAIICGGLCGKLELQLEAAGSQIVPVIGKGEFPLVSKLFRMLGKTPVALIDADGIADNVAAINSFLQSEAADEIANSKFGQEKAVKLSRSIYDAFSTLVQRRWHEIEPLAKSHSYWTSRNATEDDIKPKRRAAFSTLFEHTDEALDALSADKAWGNIKRRLKALLDLLESQGCFVLRRGTIESYYRQNSAVSEKVLAAATEAASFGERDAAEIERNYDDIVRCLRKVAAVPSISEADSLQDTLLQAAAPIFARFQNGESIEELQALAKSVLGSAADIFSFSRPGVDLEIKLNSKVLDVDGFPMTLAVQSNLVDAITRALGTRK